MNEAGTHSPTGKKPYSEGHTLQDAFTRDSWWNLVQIPGRKDGRLARTRSREARDITQGCMVAMPSQYKAAKPKNSTLEKMLNPLHSTTVYLYTTPIVTLQSTPSEGSVFGVRAVAQSINPLPANTSILFGLGNFQIVV